MILLLDANFWWFWAVLRLAQPNNNINDNKTSNRIDLWAYTGGWESNLVDFMLFELITICLLTLNSQLWCYFIFQSFNKENASIL